MLKVSSTLLPISIFACLKFPVTSFVAGADSQAQTGLVSGTNGSGC